MEGKQAAPAPDLQPGEGETLDPFLDGRLRFLQPRKGYRFSVDAPLLAGFVRPRPGDTLVDLGSGCGVVAVLLAHLHPDLRLVAVEVQPELADLARRNAALNGFGERIEVRCQDARRFGVGEPAAAFDWVVANPPFHPPSRTRPSAGRQQALARQEILLRPEELLDAARRLLRDGGRLGLVHRPWRWEEIRRAMVERGLHPARIRYVRPRRGRPSNLVLAEARQGPPGEVRTLPPLELFAEGGAYTAEAEALLRRGELLAE